MARYALTVAYSQEEESSVAHHPALAVSFGERVRGLFANSAHRLVWCRNVRGEEGWVSADLLQGKFPPEMGYAPRRRWRDGRASQGRSSTA